MPYITPTSFPPNTRISNALINLAGFVYQSKQLVNLMTKTIQVILETKGMKKLLIKFDDSY